MSIFSSIAQRSYSFKIHLANSMILNAYHVLGTNIPVFMEEEDTEKQMYT